MTGKMGISYLEILLFGVLDFGIFEWLIFCTFVGIVK
jgi:hypothetical protein